MQIPLRLDLEITRKCKYKCHVCSVRATDEEYVEVSLEDFKNKIHEFWLLGGAEISITGGEPTERGIDFLADLISYSSALNLKVRMYTVGYGIQNQKQVEILAKSGLNTAIVSLEGDKSVDELYKGISGSYEVAIRAIQLFRSEDIEVIIHFTPTRINYEYFSHVVEIAKLYDVAGIRVMPFVAQGRGWDNRQFLNLDEDELNHFVDSLKDLREKNKDIIFQISGFFDKGIKIAGHSETCALNKKRLVVTSDGFLIPSLALRMYKENSVPRSDFNLGKIEEKSIIDAWDSFIMTYSRNSSSGCGICPPCAKD